MQDLPLSVLVMVNVFTLYLIELILDSAYLFVLLFFSSFFNFSVTTTVSQHNAPDN